MGVRQFMSDQAVREEMVTNDDKGVCGRVKEMYWSSNEPRRLVSSVWIGKSRRGKR